MHIKNIHCAIEKLAEDLKCDTEKGIETMNVEIAGKEADMLKDLAEAEYYFHVSKAMEESEKEDEEEAKFILKQMKEEYGDEDGERMYRMGYNRNRYSNGRFAPKGRGRRMGYMPPMMDGRWDEDDYLSDYLGNPEFMTGARMRLGYGDGGMNGGSRGGNYGGNSGRSGGSRGGRSGYGDGEDYGMDGRSGRGEGSRYGQSYQNYRTAKRHYTESKDPEEQKKMKDSIAEVFDDMEDITVEMIRDMTPEEKTRYKQKLQTMMQKMQ